MKRIACILLILVLFILPALADPLPLLEDYAVDISEPYDENDPSAGTFVFSCRYPHADETAEGAAGINAFYEYDLDDTVLNMVPMLQDAFEGTDYSMTTTYEVTCNNDDYFSVLIRTEKKWADHLRTGWKGQVFSRKQGMGATCTLPTLLGILAPDENEEWIQDYKNKEAETLVRKMVWEMIEDYDGEYDLSELTEEYLEALFFPGTPGERSADHLPHLPGGPSGRTVTNTEKVHAFSPEQAYNTDNHFLGKEGIAPCWISKSPFHRT